MQESRGSPGLLGFRKYIVLPANLKAMPVEEASVFYGLYKSYFLH
jgi:hypothetical protein